jgi:hypothetical protein
MSESSLSPTGSSQKNQRLALVAVVGVAVVGVIVYLLLFSGGSSSSPAAARVTPHVQSSAVASSSPSAVQAVPAAYTAAVGRDPFQPALTPPPAATASSSAAAASAAAASASKAAAASPSPTLIVIPTLTLSPTPTVTVTASPSPTATVTVTPSPTGLPTAGNSITLTLVRADNTGTVDVTVTNGATTTPYNGVAPGQVFGTYFKLVSILSDTSTSPTTYGADFEYGDQFVQLAKSQSATLG